MTTSIMPTSAANIAGTLINLDSAPTPAPKISFQLEINIQQGLCGYCVVCGLHPNRAYVRKISEVKKHRKHSTGPTPSIHHMSGRVAVGSSHPGTDERLSFLLYRAT